MPRDEQERRPAGDAIDVPERNVPDLGEAASAETAWGRQAGAGAILVAMEHTTGPLPSKDWLDAAETHYPGVTKALVDDYIAEREHARELLREAAAFDQTSFFRFAHYQRSQLVAATAIVLVIALGGVVLALDGKSLYGFALLVFEVAGLVLAFLYGRARSGNRPTPPQDDE